MCTSLWFILLRHEVTESETHWKLYLKNSLSWRKLRNWMLSLSPLTYPSDIRQVFTLMENQETGEGPWCWKAATAQSNLPSSWQGRFYLFRKQHFFVYAPLRGHTLGLHFENYLTLTQISPERGRKILPFQQQISSAILLEVCIRHGELLSF